MDLNSLPKNASSLRFSKHNAYIFAVGESPTTVLLRAVKGGGNLPLTEIFAIFKVQSSLFILAHFFIDHLTLSSISYLSFQA